MIETKRLILRPLTSNDAYKCWENIFHDHDVLESFMANYQEEYNEHCIDKLLTLKYFYAVCLKDSQEFIGIIFITDMDNNIPEIGYAYGKKYWHQGYASEALIAYSKYLNDEGYHSQTSEHFAENPISGKVMEKAMMKYYATKENAIEYHGKLHDLLCYRIEY